ncbi:MAG: oligosaccharide flippase family protein, partial [Chloroflexota bacterium]
FVLALTLGPALILPALSGSLQGWQDFQGMSIAGLIGPVMRLTAGAGLVWLGFGVSGALGGFLVAGLAAAGFTAFLLARRLIDVPPQPPAVTLKELIQFSLQVAVAALAFAALTNTDVVFARHFFPAEQAGHYSAAATLGKIVLFLPGPVATLMFPKASARHAARASRTSMLRKSALATLGLSLVVVAIFVVWPVGITRLLYGSEYTEAGQWLSLYGLAMIGTALVNLLMFHYLAAREARFVGIMLCFAVGQVLLLAFAPANPLTYIAVVAGSAWGILLVAEAWLGGLRKGDVSRSV